MKYNLRKVKITNELRDKIDKMLRQKGLTFEEVINNPAWEVIITTREKEQEGK